MMKFHIQMLSLNVKVLILKSLNSNAFVELV